MNKVVQHLYQAEWDPSIELVEREADRLPINFAGNLECAGKVIPVQVENVSRYGFMAEGDCVVPIGAKASLIAPSGRTLEAKVCWSLEGRTGCVFEEPISWDEVFQLALD